MASCLNFRTLKQWSSSPTTKISFLKYRKGNKLDSRNPTDPAEYFTGNGSNLCQAMPLKSQDERQPLFNSVKSQSTQSEGGCQQKV